MPGIYLNWDDKAAQAWLGALAGREHPDLMDALGRALEGIVRGRFAQRGPGWKPKSPLFAYWEGGKDSPLVFRGALLRGVFYTVLDGHTTAVGSNLPYAATQQFGTDGPRYVVFHILPEYESAERTSVFGRPTRFSAQGAVRTKSGAFRRKQITGGPGTGRPRGLRIARFENGFPKGKLVLRQEPGTVKVLMRINIEPRPFLPEVLSASESHGLEAIVARYVEQIGGRAA